MAGAEPRLALVTGATGAIGPLVVEELLRNGWRARALARRRGDVPGAEGVVADITDRASVAAAMNGVDTVFHLAAHLHQLGKTGDDPEYVRVNLEGTRTIVEEAQRAAVRRIVFFSTIAVYGPDRGHPFTEESQPQPSTPYGETKLAAERLVLEAGGVVLRLGAVYGARVKGNYRLLARALARRRFILVGKGDNRRTLIHEADVARAAVLAATHPAARGRIYNVTDGSTPRVREIVDAICAALGRKSPRISIPVPVARLVAVAVGRRHALEKYLENVVAVSDRIRRELGFVEQHHLDDGWRKAVDDMRRLGRI